MLKIIPSFIFLIISRYGLRAFVHWENLLHVLFHEHNQIFFFKNFLALSQFFTNIIFGKISCSNSYMTFKTSVKIFFIVLFGLEKQIVLVTSVVPYLYWPPESHKKISFFCIVCNFFISTIMDYGPFFPEPAIVSKLE